MMKTLWSALILIAALGASSLVQAREVNFNVELDQYRGDGAYIALYLTQENGQYHSTLWVSGKKAKYYKHLAGWARASGKQPSEYDGRTGASVHSGQSLEVTLDIDDSLIDTGHLLHVDTAVEDKRDYRDDVVTPLTSAGAGQAVDGRGFVKAFTYRFLP